MTLPNCLSEFLYLDLFGSKMTVPNCLSEFLYILYLDQKFELLNLDFGLSLGAAFMPVLMIK